jgi:predicted component of viral defense system (DUF524 family)
MERQEGRIVNRDQLLEETDRLVEGIRKQLEQNLAKRRRGSVDLGKELRSLSSELKRVIEFYQRRLRKGEAEVEQQALKLLRAEVPKRSNVPAYWETLRQVLTPWLLSSSSRYSPREILFILGWTFRLLRGSRV